MEALNMSTSCLCLLSSSDYRPVRIVLLLSSGSHEDSVLHLIVAKEVGITELWLLGLSFLPPLPSLCCCSFFLVHFSVDSWNSQWRVWDWYHGPQHSGVTSWLLFCCQSVSSLIRKEIREGWMKANHKRYVSHLLPGPCHPLFPLVCACRVFTVRSRHLSCLLFWLTC